MYYKKRRSRKTKKPAFDPTLFIVGLEDVWTITEGEAYQVDDPREFHLAFDPGIVGELLDGIPAAVIPVPPPPPPPPLPPLPPLPLLPHLPMIQPIPPLPPPLPPVRHQLQMAPKIGHNRIFQPIYPKMALIPANITTFGIPENQQPKIPNIEPRNGNEDYQYYKSYLQRDDVPKRDNEGRIPKAKKPAQNLENVSSKKRSTPQEMPYFVTYPDVERPKMPSSFTLNNMVMTMKQRAIPQVQISDQVDTIPLNQISTYPTDSMDTEMLYIPPVIPSIYDNVIIDNSQTIDQPLYPQYNVVQLMGYNESNIPKSKTLITRENIGEMVNENLGIQHRWGQGTPISPRSSKRKPTADVVPEKSPAKPYKIVHYPTTYPKEPTKSKTHKQLKRENANVKERPSRKSKVVPLTPTPIEISNNSPPIPPNLPVNDVVMGEPSRKLKRSDSIVDNAIEKFNKRRIPEKYRQGVKRNLSEQKEVDIPGSKRNFGMPAFDFRSPKKKAFNKLLNTPMTPNITPKTVDLAPVIQQMQDFNAQNDIMLPFSPPRPSAALPKRPKKHSYQYGPEVGTMIIKPRVAREESPLDVKFIPAPFNFDYGHTTSPGYSRSTISIGIPSTNIVKGLFDFRAQKIARNKHILSRKPPVPESKIRDIIYGETAKSQRLKNLFRTKTFHDVPKDRPLYKGEHTPWIDKVFEPEGTIEYITFLGKTNRYLTMNEGYNRIEFTEKLDRRKELEKGAVIMDTYIPPGQKKTTRKAPRRREHFQEFYKPSPKEIENIKTLGSRLKSASKERELQRLAWLNKLDAARALNSTSGGITFLETKTELPPETKTTRSKRVYDLVTYNPITVSIDAPKKVKFKQLMIYSGVELTAEEFPFDKSRYHNKGGYILPNPTPTVGVTASPYKEKKPMGTMGDIATYSATGTQISETQYGGGTKRVKRVKSEGRPGKRKK
jgi:hypothetical protein